MGRELPCDRAVVADALGQSGAYVLVPAGYQASYLHDEYHRIFEHDAAQGVEEPGAVPER